MRKKVAYIYLIILLSSCVGFKHNTLVDKLSIADLIIYRYQHYGFHYLRITDKPKTFEMVYPVGDENYKFTGAEGPIYELRKRDFKSNEDLYIITDIKKDTVCFLDFCYSNNGTLKEIDKMDKIVFNTLDSFCLKNYSFYSIDINKFRSWYSMKK